MEDIASVVVSTKVSLLTLGTWTQGLQYSLRVCVCIVYVLSIQAAVDVATE